MSSKSSSKIAVIGTGMVGTSFAYALLIKGIVSEMALINRTRERAEGEAMDLNHGLTYATPMKIKAGGYELCRDAHMVVVTAGAKQEEGETRLDLAGKNANIVNKIVPEILKHNPSPIIMMVANPVDVLTYVALRESGLPKNRVFGSGTVLDSARFRFLLSEHCGVDPRNVHSYIIGEHGDFEVPLWSRVNIAGASLEEHEAECGLTSGKSFREKVFGDVKNAAYEIIRRKDATYYGIGLAMSRIVQAVMHNQHSVLPVSSLVEDYYGINDVCLSLPSVVGISGVEKVIHSSLAEDEAEALKKSARVLRNTLASIGY